MGITDILQMFIALGATVLLAQFLLKKLNTISHGKSDVIKVIERVPVSKTSSLSIVQVESEYLLMSLSDTKSEVIKTFTQKEKEAIQKRMTESREAQKSNALFSSYLKELKEIKEKGLHKFDEFKAHQKERNT